MTLEDTADKSLEESTAIGVIVGISMIGENPTILDSLKSPLNIFSGERYLQLAEIGMRLYSDRKNDVPLFAEMEDNILQKGYELVKERISNNQ